MWLNGNQFLTQLYRYYIRIHLIRQNFLILTFKLDILIVSLQFKFKFNMMNSRYKERAIPLISVDQSSGKYTLTTQAQEFLKSVPSPIGVVSVAGLYRTGKSYLLNQMLLNRSNGFGVGPTINPCTKGLWCWGTPIKGQSADGQKLNIIVVDTEGIGALDVDQTHDTRIFTLAILSSSCFIYNSVGSIDQTALQNLSLVVNLTKSIQLRTQKSIDDEDPDKISSYFPSFYWVVRDFSLQMLDTQGNKMTSKEYLQRALAPQKGFSQDIQQKNKIRKMLTSFFKDRECFTLVRPLIDEDKLQSLDKMNFDDLRPQFVNQVINFRKRVTGRMKAKIMNGQKLSGQLYISMLNSYVQAINEGAVPNIQNAWNYMCQQQCTKVMTEALQAFQSQLREVKIPCSQDQINRIVQNAQEVAMEKFKKKAIGEESERFLKELQTRMRERIRQIRKANADQGKTAFKKYITPFVTSIQQKISKQQFASFQDFLQQLKKLQQKINKQGPNYVDANLNCQICINKILSQGITYLFKRMKNEKQHIKKSLQQRIKLNQNQIDNLKRDRDSEQSSMREKLVLLDREKVDMTFKLEKIQMQLQRTTKQRNTEGQELSKNLNTKKAEIQQMRRDFETKINQANARVEQMSKNLHEQRSNWEKERAVYDLKVKQQNDKIEDCEKRLQSSSAKLALQTNELTQKYRQQYNKHQDQIQQLMRNLNQFKQKNEETSARCQKLSKDCAVLNEKFEASQRKLREQTSSKTRQIEKLKNEHQSQLNRARNDFMQNRDDSEKVSKEMQEKLRKQQLKAKQFGQQLKNVRSKYEKQNQVLTQQLEFTKKTLDDLRQKMNEQKAIFENKLAAAEADSGLQRQEQVKRKIAELKATHDQEMKNLQSQNRQAQKNLNFQIQNLAKIRNQLELKIKVSDQQLANLRAQNDENKQNLIYKNEQLENQMKSFQRQKVSELIAKEGLFNDKIASLQRQLQQARQNYQASKNEMNEKFLTQITQIKNYYELETEKHQLRNMEEKQKQKKKYRQMVDQYQRKLQQQSQSHQQQVERLESQLGNQINTLTATLNTLSHEKDTLSRDKVQIQQKYKQLYQSHQKMTIQFNQKFQKLLESSRVQKQNLSRRVEQLQQNKNFMQKQLLSLTHERDQYRSTTQRQSSQIQQIKLQNVTLNDKYQTTKRSLQQKLKQTLGNYMKDKSKFETDIALLQQKKDFAQQKIIQLESDLRNTKQREQEQMRVLKEKYQQQSTNMMNKYANQKKLYEDKIEKIKKQKSDMESQIKKDLSQVSKQKAICDQKIEYLQKKFSESQSKRFSQVQSLNQQMRMTKQKLSEENRRSRARIEEIQQILHNKQNQLIDLKNGYDIKIALADSKIKNLQTWGENTIAQKTQTIRNLERQLDDSRKRNQNEKSSQQLTHQQIISRMQSKYRNQITSLNQEVSRKTQQMQFMTKQHQRTIKDLNEKLAVQRQTRSSLQAKMSRVQSDFIQRQNKLTAQIQKLRMQKDGQGLEVQKILARERQNFKNKLAEFERKMNTTDNLRQQAIFDKQKQQAKWKMQKNTLQQKYEEMREAYQKEKNQTKKLMKDNQKLKAEKKKNTSYIKNQTTILTKEISTQNKQNSQIQ